MKKDMIFFSPDNQGLTSTSANHVANMAKEMVRGLETQLQSIVLYSTSVSLIGTDSAEELVKGATAEDLASIEGKLHTIAKANSLIAWLREAIKARERLLTETESLSLEDFLHDCGEEMPEAPRREKPLTDDDYFATLSLDERNRYYETETLAAVIGKAIHPDGSFAAARDALDRHIQVPREVRGEGRDTLIYSFVQTVDTASVDDLYFKLQKTYREAQAKVNSVKYDCQRTVKESEVAVSTAYADAVADYNKKMQLLEARRTAHIKKRVKEIGDMKIVIPPSLSSIFEEVSRLGKTK